MMRNFLVGIIIGVLTSMIFVPSVKACSISPDRPYYPLRHSSEIILEGTVTARGIDGREEFADLKLSKVLVGDYPRPRYRLQWLPNTSGGMCPPRGPIVEIGQDVRVYIRTYDGKQTVQGWVSTLEVPKSDDLVKREQAVARYREDRRKEYFPVGGALSKNDPETWIRLDQIPVALRARPIVARFTINGIGKLVECTFGYKGEYADLDKELCATLKDKAQPVIPLFADERTGRFQWRFLKGTQS